MKQTKALAPKQITRILSTCLLMQNSQAKRCALVLSHAACRITEVARLRIDDVLTPNGIIKTEVYLRSEICKNLKSRTIWLSNPVTREIIQEWLDHRRSKHWGMVTNSNEYQGFNPASTLIFNNRGRAYSLNPKKRNLHSGETKIYWACDSLEAQIRSVYKRCGLHGASSHSGRRSLVSNAIKNGRTLEQLAILLGHSHESTTLLYCEIDPKRLAYACSIALE